jgi:hypothetical protein
VLLPIVHAGAEADRPARQAEFLDRGLVAVKTDGGVFLSWRLLGSESYDAGFNLYRDHPELQWAGMAKLAGGLIYAGGTVDGVPRQVGVWSVDDYEQNEGFRLGAAQDGEQRSKWIEFADQPFFSVTDFLVEAEGKTGAERDAIAQRYWPDGASSNGLLRMRLSREPDGTVALSLRDGEGTERIRLAVTLDGSATVTATGADGVPRSLIND